MTHRRFVAMGIGTLTLAALASCAVPAGFVNPSGAPVRAAELARHGSGRVTKLNLLAQETQIDLAGLTANTWGYGSALAPVVRMTAGDTLRATVQNQLPKDTSVHRHGLALRNDMDGVPGVTQRAIGPGQSFTYDFVAPNPGTYWLHPHVGVQLDRALYGALIVEDPHEPLSYDDEWVVILDDWLDGVSSTPDDVLKKPFRRHGGGDGRRHDNVRSSIGASRRGHRRCGLPVFPHQRAPVSRPQDLSHPAGETGEDPADPRRRGHRLSGSRWAAT